jgi:hypothetical protein
MSRVFPIVALALACLGVTAPVSAQDQKTGSAPAASPDGRLLEIAGIFHVGSLSLAARKSFDAVLDAHTGTTIGGGGEVVFRRGPLRGLFARVDVSRFEESGQRVFVFEGQIFDLGIPVTIAITPIELTAGYRFTLTRGGSRGGRARPFPIVPYAGLGVGAVRYRETASFAQAGDDIDESFTSYHALGGADVRLWRGLSAGVEGLYRWAPDALGTSGVSEAFNETNLNGATVRVRIRAAF